MLVILFIFCFTGCKEEINSQPANSGVEKRIEKSAAASATSTTVCCWISCTNSGTKSIEVWDPYDNPWTASNMKWSWKPTTALGYSATAEIPLWKGLTDVKVRNNTVFGVPQVIIATALRFVTIATYPGGVRKWSCGFAAGATVHSAEILPNGNCIVANSETGNGYIRIFSSSQPPPNHGVNHIYPFQFAHSVLWDATHSCLWAVGTTLRKYAVTGTAADPTLTLLSEYPLPTAGGHDISAYTRDSNLMWVATIGGIYIFNKTAGTYTAMSGAAQNIDVKGISDQPVLPQIIESIQDRVTFPDKVATNTIKAFDLTTGAQVAYRTVPGAVFYKCKTFDPYYY